tara:strand:- start:247 stop:933 length:687 start_codon:yes stop_codon:yes gene_type:complete
VKINTALILCAGFGKRLNPITLETPKPLIEIKNISMLEKCIRLIEKLKIKKVLLNTFHLKDEFHLFFKKKKFNLEIKIIEEEKILDTGGGILNMINKSDQNDFIVFNPDTNWDINYDTEILKMEEIYFKKKIQNILLLVNKDLSFDKNLIGDFNLSNNLITYSTKKDFIYIGCQIINKNLFIDNKIKNFSISEIWNDLIYKKKLYGHESKKNFYHLTDLNVFKKLKDL